MINFQKSFWYLTSWHWTNGILQLTKTLDALGSIQLTTGMSPETVPHTGIDKAFHTLGVPLTPSGSPKYAIKILHEHSSKYAGSVSSSSLTQAMAYASLTMHHRPKVGFPIPTLDITKMECIFVQAPALSAALPKLHFIRKTARSIINGPPCYGSLAIPEFHAEQGIG